MSNKAVGWAFDLPLEPGLKLLLVALADRANDDGQCYPGQKTLAAKCSMGERTVRRHLAELERLGYIHRSARFRPEGRGRTSDLFTVLFDQPANLAAGTDTTNRPDDAGVTGQSRYDQPATAGRGRTNRETSENHQTTQLNVEREFKEFWNRYPRAKNRVEARAAYRSAREAGVTHERIMDGLERNMHELTARLQWCPFPARWLKDERFDDQPDYEPSAEAGPFG